VFLLDLKLSFLDVSLGRSAVCVLWWSFVLTY